MQKRSYTKHCKTKRMSDRLLVTLPSIALATVAGLGVAQKLTVLDAVYAADQGQTGVAIDAQSVLSLTLTSSSVTLPIVPTLEGQFGRASLGVKVTSNTGTGYNLAMQADKSDLVNSSADGAKIESIATGENVSCSSDSNNTCSEFPVNKWGYRVGDQNTYLSVVDTVGTLKEIDRAEAGEEDASEGRTTTVYFGAKLNNQIPTGEYSGVHITFVATANPTEPEPEPEPEVPTNISQITTMQDFAKITTKAQMDVVLETMGEEQQYTLTDTRGGGKTYLVAKLKDGNVWMTQNLDLDLTNGVELTPADSDVKANWNPERSTVSSSNLSSTTWTDSGTAPYSVDPGDKYWNNDASASSCNYFTTSCDAFSNSSFGSYGKHGHVGNYYNWSAAVASNNTSGTTGDGDIIDTSICPAGWRLPTGGDSGEFQALQNEYNWTTNTIQKGPGYFVRGGGVYNAALSNGGNSGYYWSSTAKSDTNAYYLNFGSSAVNPASNYNRYYGRSVRCIVRQPQS